MSGSEGGQEEMIGPGGTILCGGVVKVVGIVLLYFCSSC